MNNGKVFIIAEAGVNHNGDIALAKKLIDIAAKAGVDAVKFQTFSTEKLISRFAKKAAYQKKGTRDTETQFEMAKRLELGFTDFRRLKTYTKKKGIIFLSTAFDFESADFLAGLDLPVFKIPSGEITHRAFLTHIAAKGKPILLSTGMSTLAEVDNAIRWIMERERTVDVEDYFPPLTLMHCVSNYPAAYENTNLRAIATMREAFKLPVGLSDHSEGIEIALAAVALGATVIEKHFTIDKSLEGPDHRASLDGDELSALVAGIRHIEAAMGDGIKRPVASEAEIALVARRSIVARCAITRGVKISPSMLTAKRPGTGIAPCDIHLVVGRTARRTIEEDQVIEWEDI